MYVQTNEQPAVIGFDGCDALCGKKKTEGEKVIVGSTHVEGQQAAGSVATKLACRIGFAVTTPR